MTIKPILRERILARMEELGIENSFEVERRASFKRGHLYDLMRGRKNSISPKSYPGLSFALECDIDYLLGRTDKPRALPGGGDPAQSVTFAGVVEAGVWRSTDALPVLPAIAPVERDPRFPALPQIAFEVRGEGAAPVGINDGEIIIVLDWTAWERAGTPVRAPCVIRRFRPEYGEVETSIAVAQPEIGGGTTLYSASGGLASAARFAERKGERTEIIGAVSMALRIFID